MIPHTISCTIAACTAPGAWVFCDPRLASQEKRGAYEGEGGREGDRIGNVFLFLGVQLQY